MNWVFILVRTFPFWAIPLGLVFIGSSFRGEKKKSQLLIGVVMIALSVAFIFFQGHFMAVPFLYEATKDPLLPPQ
jgi:hypothetical protein